MRELRCMTLREWLLYEGAVVWFPQFVLKLLLNEMFFEEMGYQQLTLTARYIAMRAIKTLTLDLYFMNKSQVLDKCCSIGHLFSTNWALLYNTSLEAYSRRDRLLDFHFLNLWRLLILWVGSRIFEHRFLSLRFILKTRGIMKITWPHLQYHGGVI